MIKMKDSGIEWIGEIPCDWEVGKVKNYYSIQTGFTPDTKNPNYYDFENGYDWITIGDLNGKRYIPKATKSKISQQYVNKYNPEIIPKGSLLYSFKLSVGQVAFADRDVYSNEAIASFIASENVDLRFLFYSSYMIVQNANENIYGAKLLNQDLIKNAYIVFPPLETQHRITDYLDERCKKIDAIIEKQQAVIEKLKEYKLSVITETITKGLNSNVEMATLNGEWVDSIPAHWKWMSLKSVTDFITCGVAATPEYTDKETGVLFLSAQNVKQGTMDYSIKRYITKELHESLTKKRKPQRGDLLQVRVGASIGNVAVVDTDEEFSVYVSLTHLRCNQMIQNEFLKFCMMSPLWLQKAFSYVDFAGSQGNLNVADLRILKVPVPPTNEQIDIMNYLNNKTQRIDYNIRCREETLNKLHEYKKSLIYEVVTGKKEV